MHPRTHRLLVVGAVLGVYLVVSAVAWWLMSASEHYHSATHGALEIGISWAFGISGIVAWDRRPGNPVGPLLVVVGLGWSGQAATTSDSGWVFGLGYVSYGLFLGAIIALLIVFPSGRIESRAARVLIVAGCAEALLFPALLLVSQPGTLNECKGCPDNPYAVVDDRAVQNVAYGFVTAFGALLGVAVIGFLIVRFRRASLTRRRALTPVAVAGAVAALAFAVSNLAALVGSDLRGPSGTVAEACLLLVPLGFVVGLLREQLFRSSALGGLVGRLAMAITPADVQAALADELRDPKATIGFWIEERGIYVDADGHPLSAGTGGMAEAIVEREARRIAVIRHDPALSEDPALLASVAAAAELALERARLDAELRLRLSELAASRARLVSAADAARHRIERDLHDGAQQRLVGLALALRLARSQAGDPIAVSTALDECSAELALALEELRELARGIHPAVLTQRGLVPAIAALADRASVPVETRIDLPGRLAPPVEAALYFVAAEALTNVAKYAGASHVAIAAGLDGHGQAVTITITDDGVGGADPAAGSGLRGLKDRVEAVGGVLRISSSATGTAIAARVPVAAEVTA